MKTRYLVLSSNFKTINIMMDSSLCLPHLTLFTPQRSPLHYMRRIKLNCYIKLIEDDVCTKTTKKNPQYKNDGFFQDNLKNCYILGVSKYAI